MPTNSAPYRKVAEYRHKLMSADCAAGLIASGAKVAMGLGVAAPRDLLGALADRAAAGGIDGVRLYYLLSTAVAGETVLRYELRDRIRPMSLFHGAVERALDARAVAAGQPPVDLLPTAFSQTPRLLSDVIDVDVLITTVSPIDEDGYFSFGTNTDYALACSRSARQVIVEVNSNMPRVGGDCKLHISAVTAMVESEAPLIEIPRATRRPEDDAIGAIIAGLAGDGDCLQMGIGALPDAVCAALHGHRHLGVHTELMTPAWPSSCAAASSITAARRFIRAAASSPSLWAIARFTTSSMAMIGSRPIRSIM